MRTKRIVRGFRSTGLRVAVVALLAFAAPAFAQLPGGTLDHVRARGGINFGYFPNARPVSFQDASGNADGYAVALCQAVADAVKAQLKMPNLAVHFVALSDNDAGRKVQMGDIDMVCAPIQPTLARRATMSFSLPVFQGGTSILVRHDAPHQLVDAIEGKKIAQGPLWRGSPMQVLVAKRDFAVLAGSASERWAKTRAKELRVNSTFTPVTSLAAGLQRVKDGASLGFLADRTVLLDLARNDDSVMVLDRTVAPSRHALVLRRNDDDFRLLVDRVLSGLYSSGQIDGVYAKYFGKEQDATRDWFRMVALPNG